MTDNQDTYYRIDREDVIAMAEIAYQDDRLDDEQAKEWCEALRDKYHFYILNPPNKNGFEYSLWVREDGFEYPILNSNTGGFTTFSSRHNTVGDGIRPTEEFMHTVAYGFTEAMSFMPHIWFRDDHSIEHVERMYDGKTREYESWAALNLISYFSTNENDFAPELEPLARWVDANTKWDVPALEAYESEVNDES